MDEARIGGRKGTGLFVILLSVVLLMMGAAGLIAWMRQSRSPAQSPAVAPHADSVLVLWSKWTDEPDTFRIRVRLYRQDHQPILGSTVSPELIDAGTNARLGLFGNTTFFEKWDHQAPGNGFETTMRARMATTPAGPTKIVFDNGYMPPPPPEPFWVKILGKWYRPPVRIMQRYRLQGKPLVLPAPPKKKLPKRGRPPKALTERA